MRRRLRFVSDIRLVEEAIAEKAEKSVEERLDKAYDMLAAGSAEDDIEDFFAVQAEVLDE
jgi:hypothetical protein